MVSIIRCSFPKDRITFFLLFDPRGNFPVWQGSGLADIKGGLESVEMESQEIFLLLQPTLSFFRPGASFAFRSTQETQFVASSHITAMHFAKLLILPVVLALTAAAAPVPALNGNMVTLNARCHTCHAVHNWVQEKIHQWHTGSTPTQDHSQGGSEIQGSGQDSSM
ncbi:hypothetical protein FRC16_006986, partial [Serendipita sp. 398]